MILEYNNYLTNEKIEYSDYNFMKDEIKILTLKILSSIVTKHTQFNFFLLNVSFWIIAILNSLYQFIQKILCIYFFNYISYEHFF